MKKYSYLLLLASLVVSSACSSNASETTPPAASTASSSAPTPTPAQPVVQTAPATPAPVAAAPPADPAAIASGPKVFLPMKKIDFGKQAKDLSLNRVIKVKNTGKGALNIESVTPSCGCTTVDFPKSIAPGKEGSIKVRLNTGTSPGVHTKTVTIKTNDPAEPTVIVELVVDVKA